MSKVRFYSMIPVTPDILNRIEEFMPSLPHRPTHPQANTQLTPSILLHLDHKEMFILDLKLISGPFLENGNILLKKDPK